MTRQILWLLIGVVLVWTSMVQAAGVKLLTHTLPGDDVVCYVFHVSDHPQQVTLEVLDSHGQFVVGFNEPALPPLTVAGTQEFHNGGLYMCRLTSTDGKQGDFRVTFCSVASGHCHAVVTAQ
jgi:hypothetical protein